MPNSEDLTLHGISYVTPDDSEPCRLRNEWAPGTPLHLLFTFHGGLSIEIAAEEVEFLARPKAATKTN